MGDLKAPPTQDLRLSARGPVDLQQFISLDDFQQGARRSLPKALYEYLASGTEDEQTLHENRQAFKRILLVPRVMRNLRGLNASVSLLRGRCRSSMPVLISPAGVHGLVDPEGEITTACAAMQHGIVMGYSQHSTRTIEEVAEAARAHPNYHPSLLWYQLYILKDRQLTAQLVARAQSAGYGAIVLTVDSVRFGFREADWRNGFNGLPEGLSLANYPSRDGYDDRESQAWDQNTERIFDETVEWAEAIAFLRSLTHLPIIAKGVLCPEDALAAVRGGCEGVIVSNHGGRQLDGCVSSIEVLEPIVQAVRSLSMGQDITIMLDSGVRRGTDVIKALSLGAQAVLIGKPVFFSLAVGGQAGLERMLQLMRTEVENAMALCGCRTVQDIDRSLVMRKDGMECYQRPKL